MEAPIEQSNNSDEEGPDKSQSSNGSNKSELSKQLVMRHVKSRLGRMASKSPPHPTYL